MGMKGFGIEGAIKKGQTSVEKHIKTLVDQNNTIVDNENEMIDNQEKIIKQNDEILVLLKKNKEE